MTAKGEMEVRKSAPTRMSDGPCQLGGQALERLSYRINDACTALGLGRTTVYKLAGEGQLRLFKVGGRTLVDASSLRDLINRQP